MIADAWSAVLACDRPGETRSLHSAGSTFSLKSSLLSEVDGDVELPSLPDVRNSALLIDGNPDRSRTSSCALADGREWLVAGRFTIADIAIGYAAFLATTLGADDVLGDATKAWLARCTAREGFIRARERQKR